MRSYLSAVADASRTTELPAARTSAGKDVIWAADLWVQGMMVTAEGRACWRVSRPCSAARW